MSTAGEQFEAAARTVTSTELVPVRREMDRRQSEMTSRVGHVAARQAQVEGQLSAVEESEGRHTQQIAEHDRTLGQHSANITEHGGKLSGHDTRLGNHEQALQNQQSKLGRVEEGADYTAKQLQHVNMRVSQADAAAGQAKYVADQATAELAEVKAENRVMVDKFLAVKRKIDGGFGFHISGSDYTYTDAFANPATPALPPLPATGMAVHVSSSRGDDNNDATADRPVKTIAEGLSRMRSGYHPDRLLLQHGDTFREVIGKLQNMGGNADGHMVIGGFGDSAYPLPRFETGTGSNGIIGWVGADRIHVHNLHFAAAEAEGTGQRTNIQFIEGNDHIVSGCRLDFCNLIARSTSGGPRMQSFTIRHNVVFGAYSTDSHISGSFLNRIDGIDFHHNIYDHNGWHPTIAGAGGTRFNHNIYGDSECTGIRCYSNVFMRAAAAGFQARPGGEIDRNLFIGNGDLPFYISDGMAGEASIAIGNISMHNHGMPQKDGNLAHWGMQQYIPPEGGAVCKYNIMAHDPEGRWPFRVRDANGTVDAELWDPQYEGLISVAGNVVYNWGNSPSRNANGPDHSASFLSYDAQNGGAGTLASVADRFRNFTYKVEPVRSYLHDRHGVVIPEGV